MNVRDLAQRRPKVDPAEARDLRQKSNVLVKEMAVEVGVAAATMSRYEAGVLTPRGERLERWAAALADLRKVAGRRASHQGNS